MSAAKLKTSLKILQQNYFDASAANANNANTAIGNMQSALLTIIIAELAFEGTTDLSAPKPSLLGGLAAVFLIAAAFAFALGAHTQYRHVLKISRHYFKLSKDVTEFMAKTGTAEIDKLPKFLGDDNSGIRSNPWANRFFLLSILLTLSATVLLTVHLFQRIF